MASDQSLSDIIHNADIHQLPDNISDLLSTAILVNDLPGQSQEITSNQVNPQNICPTATSTFHRLDLTFGKKPNDKSKSLHVTEEGIVEIRKDAEVHLKIEHDIVELNGLELILTVQGRTDPNTPGKTTQEYPFLIKRTFSD